MKKLYFLLLIFSLGTQAQIVDFPDANFKTLLLQSNTSNDIAKDANENNIKIDTNNDGDIQQSEALRVYYMNLGANNILDLTGIKLFENLFSLIVQSNPVSELDISGMANIRYLRLDLPQLVMFSTVNVNLKNLYFDNVLLTTLDLRHMSNLESVFGEAPAMNDCNFAGLANLRTADVNGPVQYFDATGTALSRISFPNANTIVSYKANATNFTDPIINFIAPNLTIFELHNTPPTLTTLDIHTTSLTAVSLVNCSSLKNLNFWDSPINTVDLSILPNLEQLGFFNTFISSLDVSMLGKLWALYLDGNPIRYLNLKNGTSSLIDLGITGAPQLDYICANEEQIQYVREQAQSFTVVGSDCTFTPGGNYNTITGKLRFDGDSNGCDVNEPTFPFIKMKLTSDGNERISYTKSTGDYTFYTVLGGHIIEPAFENAQYFNASPQTALVNFPSLDGLVHVQDFCIAANGIHPDVEIVIAPLNNARPGFDTHYKIVYKNKGNQTLSGNIAFNYDETLLDYVLANPTPAAQISGRLTFDYLNLRPFENKEIIAVLNLNSPVEQPPVNIDDELVFTAEINPVATDASPDDNYFTFRQTVIGSYDPNDKTCLEGNIVSTDNIGKYLHYNINFENTGNADAVNVVIRDTINMGKFDLGSLQVLNSSHPVVVNIKANIVEFIFENINLPPSIINPIGGHGNVLFKIKTKGNLYPGDTVENTANIYFDYNAPIVTNEAKTTFAVLNAEQFNRDTSIKLEPNPTRDFIKIRSKNTLQSVQLFDVNGRILQTAIENKKETTIDLSAVTKGIYFVKITSDKGSKIEKLVKE